jgi:hypothetical protein
MKPRALREPSRLRAHRLGRSRAVYFGRAVVASALSFVGAAHAQGVSDTALAEGLFRSGKALFQAGKYADACPKFAESQRIDAKLGTLMNLALCHEKEGKIASAWAEYTQAGQIATRIGQADRARVAIAGAAALEPTLAHITLQPASTDPITVVLDGKAIGMAALGASLPIDPGAHEVVASAPGHKTFTRAFSVASTGGDQTISIPKLESDDAPPVPPVLATDVVSPSPATPPGTVRYGHPLLGYSLMGGGAALVVTGAIFGGLAFSEKSVVRQQCSAVMCTQPGSSDLSTLKAYETTSTITVTAGLVAGAAGLYFWLRSGTREESPTAPLAGSLHVDPVVGFGMSGLSLSGAF